MPELTMGIIETRFAEMIWEREPISAAELTKLSEKELGWKRPTMYTVLRRLCEKGIFKNVNGIVTSLISREEFKAAQSQQLIDGSFGGSLPAFLAAFTKRRALSESEISEIRKLIDSGGKED